MGYYSKLTRAVADGPNTITIRKVTWDEHQQIATAALVFPSYAMAQNGVIAQGEIRMDPTRVNRRWLELGIVSWEGPDFLDDDGNAVPCTNENKIALPPAVGDRLIEEIKAFSELSSAEKNA